MQLAVKGLSYAAAGPVRIAMGTVQQGRAHYNQALIVGTPNVQEVEHKNNSSVPLDHGRRSSDIKVKQP